MREINRDPGLAGIMGWWPLEAGPGVSLMSWPVGLACTGCCSVHSRPPCSEDVTLGALTTKTLIKYRNNFFPATRLMWSGTLQIIDFEILLLWAVNAKLWRTTNEVVRIVNCQNMIWARERRHEQPVTRITRREKLRSGNKSFTGILSVNEWWWPSEILRNNGNAKLM